MRAYYFDDSGDRSKDVRSPFFVVGGFGIDADQLPELQERTRRVAASFGLSLKHPTELKFNHVGRNEDNDDSKPHWMLQCGLTERHLRRALVMACLRQIVATPTVKVMAVAVDKRLTYGSATPMQLAIEPLAERISFDLAEHETTGLMFCDEERGDDKELRRLTRSGSWYLKFDRILDTIAFMPSAESIGVQLADLVAGAVSRYLNTGDPGYIRVLWSVFRCNAHGRVSGYGIKLFPHGVLVTPPPQPVPWPDLDRRVYEAEWTRYGATVTWTTEGAPETVMPAAS